MDFLSHPYPGLRPFRQDECDIFFGRDQHIADLRKKVEKDRFVAVVGSSGSGKSSLVKAGLLPQLTGAARRKIGSASSRYSVADWRIAKMRPGSCPITNLVTALRSDGALGPERARMDLYAELAEPARRLALEQGDAQYIASTLRRGPLGLVELLAETPLPPETHLLLVIDQFEEIFRYGKEGPPATGTGEASLPLTPTVTCEWANEAEAFVNLLLRTVADADLHVHVLITMRLDFLGDCSLFYGLPEAINHGQFLTPGLTRKQCSEAIVGPARVCGGEITADLVNTLLNETTNHSDALPALQHCLMRMWSLLPGTPPPEGRSDWVLRMENYRDERIGTLKNCLSNHANSILRDLGRTRASYRKLTEVAFQALVKESQGKRDTRRPQSLEALGHLAAGLGETREDLLTVLQAFRQPDCSFLMPPAEEPLTDASTLDISHESLIRNWDQLGAWVKEEAAAAEEYRFIEQTARKWKVGRARPWGTPDLENATVWYNAHQPSKAWASRYGGDFELAVEFLEASRQAQEDRRADETARIENEKQQLKKLADAEKSTADALRAKVRADEKNWKLRRWLGIAALLLVLGAAATIWVWWTFSDKERVRQLNVFTAPKMRGREFLVRANKTLEGANTDPLKTIKGLGYSSLALHLFPSRDAANRVCNLLLTNEWCPPLTHELRYAADSGVLSAATFAPEGDGVFAVSQINGQLLQNNEDGTALVECGYALVDREPAAKSSHERSSLAPFGFDRGRIAGAQFSPDGRHLLLIPIPARIDPPKPALANGAHPAPHPSPTPGPGELPRFSPVKATIWNWDAASRRYLSQSQLLEIENPASVYAITWAPDNQRCIVISMHFPLAACQVFRLYDGAYVPDKDALRVKDDASTPEKMLFKKADIVAVSVSADSQHIATVSSACETRLWETARIDEPDSAQTLGELRPQTADAMDTRPIWVAFGPGANELTVGFWGLPAVVRNYLSNEQSSPVQIPSVKDAFMRLTYADPRTGKNQVVGEPLVATSLYGRIRISTPAQPETPVAQPICFEGVSPNPIFDRDGTRLLTLSGSSWGALDTLRVWDVRLQKKFAGNADLPVDDTQAPPDWLADLADAVSGLRLGTGEDQVTKTMDQVRKEGAQKVPGEYAKVWNRFFEK